MSFCAPPKSPKDVNFVIYHGFCTDGFSAAFAAWKLLGEEGVTYHGTQHGLPAPDVKGKHVAVVDFSYKLPVFEQLLRDAASLIVLDHHKTAEAELTPHPNNVVFDMKRSGATISWAYFHPGTPVF